MDSSPTTPRRTARRIGVRARPTGPTPRLPGQGPVPESMTAGTRDHDGFRDGHSRRRVPRPTGKALAGGETRGPALRWQGFGQTRDEQSAGRASRARRDAGTRLPGTAAHRNRAAGNGGRRLPRPRARRGPGPSVRRSRPGRQGRPAPAGRAGAGRGAAVRDDPGRVVARAVRRPVRTSQGHAPRPRQTRSAAISTYWKDPSLYELMNASSIPVTSEEVARSSQ